MKRVKVAPQRIRVTAKPSYEELEARLADLEFSAETDARAYKRLEERVTNANHEITQIQLGYRNTLQKAQEEASRRTRKQVETEFTREMQSLNFRLAETTAERDKAVKTLGRQARGMYEDGANFSCPECGCVIRPVLLADAPVAASRKKRS